MDRVVNQRYLQWCNCATEDNDLIVELNSIRGNDHLINDAFYRDLEFGTGGLRGVIGAGTNRMNIYTVRKASQGLANYLNKYYKNPSIAISYDSRIKSKLFAETAAEIFSGNGIKVYIYKQLMPTPCLSFAVRKLKCCGGIMVTASHNPSKYNGYKVYGPDGCQITTVAAELITKEISEINPFEVKTLSFDEYIKTGVISYISDKVYDCFIERVKKESVIKENDIDRNVKIVYSPLNGTGLKPVIRILKETGFNNVVLVKEQENPDGLFPTCPYPNPEIEEAMALGIKYAKENDADLLIATDPDCDRVGIAVKDKENNFVLLSGNQTGALLLDFICSMRLKNGTMPKNACAVKTIVTTDLIDSIAIKYKVKLYSVLTGFKYIGDTIAKLEKENQESSYILGMEESYGYLTGSYVRDKDAVDGVFMIAEMFAYYKTIGKSLLDRLNELYLEHGYFLNKLETFEFDGISGMKKMSEIMRYFREKVTSFGDFNVERLLDYSKGVDGLPSSDVLKFFVDGNTVTIRPSGTEPKIKVYYSIRGENEKVAKTIFKNFSKIVHAKLS